MKRICLMLTFLLAYGLCPDQASSSVPDVFWIDRYGSIPWNDEKVRLDNFAIQLAHDPNQIGLVIVNAGLVSCKGEAQSRAVRAKNYLVQVRGVPWNRIIWRDIGYREEFEVSLWLVPQGKPPRYNPEFKSGTPKHVVKECDRKSAKRRLRGTS